MRRTWVARLAGRVNHVTDHSIAATAKVSPKAANRRLQKRRAQVDGTGVGHPKTFPRLSQVRFSNYQMGAIRFATTRLLYSIREPPKRTSMAHLVLALAHAPVRPDPHAARPALSFRRSRRFGFSIDLLRRVVHRRPLRSRSNPPSSRPFLVTPLLATPQQTARRHRTLQSLT